MSDKTCPCCGGNGLEGSDCENIEADLEARLAAERALADKLARALTRMLHLHDNGTWSGSPPDERARKVIKQWKEVRNE